MFVKTIMQEIPVLLLWSGLTVYSASGCVFGDFDAPVRHYLCNAMLSSAEVHQISLGSNRLQKTLRTRWKGANLTIYGSIPSGLGTKISDVDFILNIPNYNKTADSYLVKEAAGILYKEPAKYKNIVLKHVDRVPMMSFHDNSMQRDVDLAFRSGNRVVNVKVIAYYLNLDKRFRALAAIIKHWLKVHRLRVQGMLSNYAVVLMVIFFLQQKNMCPSGFETQVHLPPRKANSWNTNFEKIPYNIDNDDSLYELLGGFYEYYSKFNFKDYIVSTFVGHPILRSDFEDLNSIPDEFSMYKRFLRTSEQEPLDLNNDICIQDIFVHNVDAGTRTNSKNISIFLNELMFAAKMYREQSKERYYRYLLYTDRYNQTLMVKK